MRGAPAGRHLTLSLSSPCVSRTQFCFGRLGT
uniref:Uncharacterized protein n=1 Tax=Arundo donax TaxID=35708 RepID=A0A0A9BJN2_ARUDO